MIIIEIPIIKSRLDPIILTIKNAFKYGTKIRIGIIHEIFLYSDKFMNLGDLNLGYIYLIDKVLKATTRHFIGLLIYKSALRDHNFNGAFKSMNFIRIKEVVIMVKQLIPNL